MKGIAVVGVCILAAMIVVKDGRLFRTTGLMASCSKVASTASADVEACRAGNSRAPDLTKRGCKFAASVKQVAYWNCPSDTQPDNPTNPRGTGARSFGRVRRARHAVRATARHGDASPVATHSLSRRAGELRERGDQPVVRVRAVHRDADRTG